MRVTTPFIPGLELRIPRGLVVKDSDGKIVRSIGITPVPVDRPPFPLPRGVEVPVYFTVQPGRAYVFPKGAQLVYPNYTHEAPGTRENFWSYEPDEGWHVYGQGTVSVDGKQVAPDPNVRIYKLTGAMISVIGLNPSKWFPNFNKSPNGDPVDAATGLFIMNKTDLFLPGQLPISLARTYQQGDGQSRSFGKGMNWIYGMFLWSAQQYQQADLNMPDGARIHYVRTSSGTSYIDAVFESTSTLGPFYKSVMRWNGRGWNLMLRNGITYVFGENAPLQAIRDHYGNQITVLHASDQLGNITQVKSSNGEWIKLSYDSYNRVTHATDNIGRTVRYTYDASGRLSTVTDAAGGVTTYTYDTSARMTSITDPKGIMYLTNKYDSNGRVIEQTQADGSTYEFSYTLDANNQVTRTDITDPRGDTRRTSFNKDGYPTSDTVALGTPQEQTTTYNLQTGTNFLLSAADSLGRVTEYTYNDDGTLSDNRSVGHAKLPHVQLYL